MSAEDINPAEAMAEAMLRSYIKGDDVSTCSLCHTKGHVTKNHPVKGPALVCDYCYVGSCMSGKACDVVDPAKSGKCPCNCSNRRSKT